MKKRIKSKKLAPEKPKETKVEFLASLAATFATLLFVMTFMVQAFAIPSSSMENTLLIGDHVLVDRVQFAPKASWAASLLPYRDIRRGDIVVFLSPETPGLHIVKRIIGIPGDRIHLRDGVVYRNGVKLDEPYVLHDADDLSDRYRNDFPSIAPPEADPNIYDRWRAELAAHIQGEDIVVPADSYFGMGDHRGVSLDSRYWGFIPRQNVIGRPMFVYWSFETSAGDYLNNSATDRVGSLAHTIVHFFDETRWRRTLRTVK
jgi:signal peptidase I